MKFNDAVERMRFNAKWERLRKEYRNAGFSEEGIEAMYQFDLAAYREERNHRIWQADLPFTTVEDLPDESLMRDAELRLNLFLGSSSNPGSFNFGRYGWIDEIEDEDLLKRIKALNKDDLELLTLYVFDEKTQAEIAAKYGISQKRISEKLSRIKSFLQKGV